MALPANSDTTTTTTTHANEVEVSTPNPGPDDDPPAPPKDDDSKGEASATKPTCWQRIIDIYWGNEFVILIILSILLAKAYPPLGAVYVAPQITATWIVVIFIFGLAGLTLKTEELTKAFQQLRFNLFVQTYNFGFISGVVYLVSRLLIRVDVLGPSLADGMVICACLPVTINMVCVFTLAAGGDEAASIFNAAFGNMIGVFLSPLLILGYLGITGDINLGDVFYKLCLRVVLPVLVGQIIRKFSKTAIQFVKKYKNKFKYVQQYCLVYIVYTVFCKTFYEESAQSSIGDIFLMILFQFILLVSFMVLSWVLLGWFFPRKPGLRVMGFFGCTQKTIAIGVPLISAMYETSPNVAEYTLPLLIWHPIQLLIGSFMIPRLLAFVQGENERLGSKDNDENKNDDNKKETDKEGSNIDEGDAQRNEAEAKDSNDVNNDKYSSNIGEGETQRNEAEAKDEEIGAPGSNYAEATEAIQEENANNSMSILTGNY